MITGIEVNVRLVNKMFDNQYTIYIEMINIRYVFDINDR